MKVSHLIATTALFASLALSANALAEESSKFTDLDTDGNGMISAEEAAADPTLVEEWDVIDVNKDGQVEYAEFSALEEKDKAEMGK